MVQVEPLEEHLVSGVLVARSVHSSRVLLAVQLTLYSL